MKKKVAGGVYLYAVFAVLACALFMAGCKPEPETGKTDTAWLLGSWSNAQSGASFTIKSDLTFEADIYPQPGQKARVDGRLDNSNSKLGPNEYLIKDLVAAKPGEPDASYTGNEYMPQGMLDDFSESLVAALTPFNDNKTEFKFTANIAVADQFFGGSYKKIRN